MTTFEVHAKRLVLPRKLVRPILGGPGLVMKEKISYKTGAVLLLDNCADDERVKLLTVFGPADCVRNAQGVIDSRIARALKALHMPADCLLRLKVTPDRAAVLSRPKKIYLGYTRAELLKYSQEPPCWKKPDCLPNLPCVLC
eukprot:m.45482 g.45482  ORF g.45482 m.45482 type:complete len:142 (+) comp33604_c0_seq1:180-605(+)